jgi:hypothetical protein
MIKRRKVNWVGHILRRHHIRKHVIEGKIKGTIEVTGRRGRRRKQLLYGHKENKGYWKLKEDALDPLCGKLASEEYMDLS